MTHSTCSYIVFIDETGFMLAPTFRRTWAPRGKTPTIKVSEPHERISAIGAMTLRRQSFEFGFHFHLLNDNANFTGQRVARFVANIHELLHSPITLLWDEYCIHRAKPVKEYLRNNPTVVAEEFPPALRAGVEPSRLCMVIR